MDTVDYTRFILAFFFVVGLIGAMGWVLRRFGSGHKMFGNAPENARLHIVEMRHLDPKRRLMLLRRDDVEHLVLLADNRETVIESNIQPKGAVKSG